MTLSAQCIWTVLLMWSLILQCLCLLMRLHKTRKIPPQKWAGHCVEGNVFNGSALSKDSAFLFYLSWPWMVSSLMTLTSDLFVSFLHEHVVCWMFLSLIHATIFTIISIRFPLQTHTQVLKVFLFWIIVIFIIWRMSMSCLLKMKLVSHNHTHLDSLKVKTYCQIKWRLQTYVSTTIFTQLEPNWTGICCNKSLSSSEQDRSVSFNYGSSLS